MESLTRVFSSLYRSYGPQGWWPLPSRALRDGFDDRGYHPGIFGIPDAEGGRWEVICGAILTQNTSWTNVERALLALVEEGISSPENLLSCPLDRLLDLVRPSGYYNQKAERLRSMASFILAHPEMPTREELLSLNGVGNETADSILLYAWHQQVFVVDAYTIRLLGRIGYIDASMLPQSASKRYEYVQNIILKGLSKISIPVHLSRIDYFSEFHALIVKHAKLHCSSHPDCVACPLEQRCRKRI